MATSHHTPFHELPEFLALTRLAGLALSPDGNRLVTSAAVLNAEQNRYVSALWEIDPAGSRPARRLTHSDAGERSPAFTSTGDVLFVSARPGSGAGGAGTSPAPATDDPPAALWLLPGDGGEARLVGERPGGIADPVTAGGVVVVTSMTMPGAASGPDDERRRTARREKKVTAMLHTGYPVRLWDHDLGPDQARLLVGGLSTASDPTASGPTPRPTPRRRRRRAARCRATPGPSAPPSGTARRGRTPAGSRA